MSVIIPHLNRSDLLEQSIASVLASTEKSFEVIVVDDGSSGDELERVRAMEGVRVRVMTRDAEPKGPSHCRNIGARAASSARLVFLDSDDIMAPWCVSQRLEQSRANPAIDLLVFPVMPFEKEPGDLDELWNQMDDGTDPAMRFARSDPPWHTSSPIWKRDAFLAMGGFDESVFYGDDSDLHMRALLMSCSVTIVENSLPDVFVRRSSTPRITNSSATNRTLRRKARLSAGTRFLRADPSREPYLAAWAGQYFAEAEFFLFNDPSPRQAVDETLAQWKADMPPSGHPPIAASIYFAAALASGHSRSLLLRIARRAAMLTLPGSYFPQHRDPSLKRVSAKTLAEIRQLIMLSHE